MHDKKHNKQNNRLRHLSSGAHKVDPVPRGQIFIREIKVQTIRNPELTNVLPSKPGVGQKIAIHAFSTARTFFLACSNFDHPGPFTFFSKSPPKFLTVLQANAISPVGLRNKIGYPADVKQVLMVSAYGIL